MTSLETTKCFLGSIPVHKQIAVLGRTREPRGHAKTPRHFSNQDISKRAQSALDLWFGIARSIHPNHNHIPIQAHAESNFGHYLMVARTQRQSPWSTPTATLRRKRSYPPQPQKSPISSNTKYIRP